MVALRTIVAWFVYAVLSTLILLMFGAVGVAGPDGLFFNVITVFLLPVMGLIIFCSNVEKIEHGNVVAIPRPAWQPAVALGVALPTIAFFNGAYPLTLLHMAWSAALFGAIAGYANIHIRKTEGYRNG